MINMKKRGDVSWEFITVLMILILMGTLFVLLKNSFVKTSIVINANDNDVITASLGCGFSMESPQIAFCEEFKTIKKTAWFVTKYHLINCDYLNSTIKASIPNIEKFDKITCPRDTWVKRCEKALISDSEKDLDITINGRECTIESLSEVKGYLEIK
jgi:hypothetical protein